MELAAVHIVFRHGSRQFRSVLGGSNALTVKNIPAEGTVTMVVRPYAKGLDGETVFYGAEYTIVYRDGEYIKSSRMENEVKKK